MASPPRPTRCLSQDAKPRSRRNSSQSGIPMAAARSHAIRFTNTQPTYDFLTGSQGIATSLRQTSRQSQAHVIVKSDIGNEDLRAQAKTLQYEVETLRQERDVSRLRYEKEIRDAQTKAEVDFKRAQASESTKHVTSHKYEALLRELTDLQDNSANQKLVLEKKLRALQEENRSVKEDLDEAQTDLSSIDRQHKHQLQSIFSEQEILRQTFRGLQDDLNQKSSEFQVSQEQLVKREVELGHKESELLKLRAQSGDVGDLVTVKRELSEQVAHIRKLEKANREQTVELRHFRQVHKAVQIVEEEKRVLANKVRAIDDLQRELGEAQFQRDILENERKSWTAYLQDSSSDGADKFDSPEAVVRALVQERMEKASFAERLGAVRSELSEKEGIMMMMNEAQAKVQTELDKLRASGGGGDSRAKNRLERQKALAVKEVEYLREQLKTFDSEDITGEARSDFEDQSRKRVQDLEELVSQYRQEIQTLNDDLSKSEPDPTQLTMQPLKRTHPDDSDERLGELTRKNRKLQSDIATLQKTSTFLQSELSATRLQLSSLQETSSTRVLGLRSNPTDDFQSLKLSTIANLRTENKALIAQLDGAPHAAKVVPISSFDAARAETAELLAEVADKEKRMLRLKQIWTLKSSEFREAVASILGWKMEFTRNGCFRMTSIFNLGNDEDGEAANGLIFDGENGLMKIAGGPDSDFGREIRPLIRFWVEERKEIPGFLAACTLEFYEKTTRAQRM